MSSVTFVHPIKATGWNEMSFGRDTCVVPSDTALDGAPVAHVKVRFWGQKPPVCTDVIYYQITLILVVKPTTFLITKKNNTFTIHIKTFTNSNKAL